MLIELGVVEQRHRAVLEVMEGLPVTEVAGRYGVTRQTVHRWLRWYARGGIAALADGSHRPATCPHRMAPEVEVRIVALRSEHPGWGPRTLLHYLAREELRHGTRMLVPRHDIGLVALAQVHRNGDGRKDADDDHDDRVSIIVNPSQALLVPSASARFFGGSS